MPGRQPNARTQFDLWKAYGDAELRGRVHPLMDRAWAWLEANWPDESAPVLNWGDARPSNIMIIFDVRPAGLSLADVFPFGPVAQLAEQQTLNLRVDGSIPSRLTTLP